MIGTPASPFSNLKFSVPRRMKAWRLTMKAFHTVAIPHRDILEGRLTMDVFAADLWEVCRQRGPDEYRDSATYFQKTYLTQGLENLLGVVKKRLSGDGGDPVIQIQTPFGGGKTHSLIALYHKAVEWNTKPTNPHTSPHYGTDLDCNLCHHQHAASEDYCAYCHDYDFKTP
jgi:hypothetical protein